MFHRSGLIPNQQKRKLGKPALISASLGHQRCATSKLGQECRHDRWRFSDCIVGGVPGHRHPFGHSWTMLCGRCGKNATQRYLMEVRELLAHQATSTPAEMAKYFKHFN